MTADLLTLYSIFPSSAYETRGRDKEGQTEAEKEQKQSDWREMRQKVIEFWKAIQQNKQTEYYCEKSVIKS